MEIEGGSMKQAARLRLAVVTMLALGARLLSAGSGADAAALLLEDTVERECGTAHGRVDER